jgi:hypothetical protein
MVKDVENMEKRIARFVIVSFILFVALNIVAVSVMLNNFQQNMSGPNTSFVIQPTVSTGTTTTGRDPDVESLDLVAGEPTHLFIHLKPNATCFSTAETILSTTAVPGTLNVYLTPDPLISNPDDSDDVVSGLMAVKWNGPGKMQEDNPYLTQYIRSIGKIIGPGCLDASTSIGTNNGGIAQVEGTNPSMALFQGDEEDEEDWAEYDSAGTLSLAESRDLINSDALDALWNMSPQKEVYVCIIDTGVDIDHPDLMNNVVMGFNPDAGDLKALGTNPSTGKKYVKEYIKGNPDPKYSTNIKIIEDGDSGHGTALAGIVASTHSPPEPDAISIKTKGISPNVKLMIAKIADQPDILQNKESKPTKKNFVAALKWCTGKNVAKRYANVIVTGVSFNKIDEFNTQVLYTDEWQISGKKNPSYDKLLTDPAFNWNEVKKGTKTDNLSSIQKVIEGKTFRVINGQANKNNPITIPLVVPAGNNPYALSSPFKSGVVNGMALLSSAITVGSVYDATLTQQQLTENNITCTDTGIMPNRTLCNSSCHTSVDYVSYGAVTYAPSFSEATANASYKISKKGTSAAAAHAAGAIAWLKNKNPNATLDQIRAALTAGATKWNDPKIQVFGIPSLCYGNGVIDAEAAYASIPSS